MRNDIAPRLLAYLVVFVTIALSYIFANLTTVSYSETSLELKGQVLTVPEGNEVKISGISDDESLDVRIRMKDENPSCYLVLKQGEKKTVINNEGCSLVYPMKKADIITVVKTSNQESVEFSFESDDGNVYFEGYNSGYHSIVFVFAFIIQILIIFFVLSRS